ncbi:hypothetical protein GQ44DRAFT_657657 [Phaeosphaeriaceae sp. PMI808]|nr:hypothetical protein GQ44DRAFT_657657 [Phaeosphaeriaceae sp. PMI808]
MASSTKTKLENLRFALLAKPHQDILRLYLNQKEDPLLEKAVLVTLHRNWSLQPPYKLTEIGIATYNRQHVNYGLPCPPGPHAEDLFNNMWSLHLRIKPHMHLPSTFNADPNAFHYGTSIYVTHVEALDLLYQIWHQPMDDARPEKGFCPILCLTFGDNDALGKVRNADFNFTPIKMDTTVAILNAQDIAVQAKITRSHDATMDYILHIFGIRPIDTANAGNAATYTNIIAFLSVLRKELYGGEENIKAKPGRKGISASKSAQSVIQRLMERPTPAPPYGVTVYCSKCSSFGHAAMDCPNTDFICSKCLRSSVKWRQENAVTHMEGLCVFK